MFSNDSHKKTSYEHQKNTKKDSENEYIITRNGSVGLNLNNKNVQARLMSKIQEINALGK